MNDAPAMTPFTLQPLLVERIWGENALHPWYEQPSPGKPIGEVWLTAEECLVEGTTSSLGEVERREPRAFGDPLSTGFPLLIKLLYPREKLSVQVHPNDEQALATLNQPRGKTECWYVLSAEPEAKVAVGFNETISTAEMRAAIEDGTIEDRLRYIAVKAGDMVFVDAGTVHAIGPGMVVLETQQYSDVTYRLWDYGRPRELHLDAGLAVARAATAAGLVQPKAMDGFRRLIECAYFTVDSFRTSEARSFELRERSLAIFIALGNGAGVRSRERSYPLAPGKAMIVPASGADYVLEVPAGVEVVRVLQPQP